MFFLIFIYGVRWFDKWVWIEFWWEKSILSFVLWLMVFYCILFGSRDKGKFLLERRELFVEFLIGKLFSIGSCIDHFLLCHCFNLSFLLFLSLLILFFIYINFLKNWVFSSFRDCSEFFFITEFFFYKLHCLRWGFDLFLRYVSKSAWCWVILLVVLVYF